MIEDELRAVFARHEPPAPDTGPLRAAINRLAVRRRRRRLAVRAAGAALAVLATVSVPVLVRTAVPSARPSQVDSGPVAPAANVSVPDVALNFLLLGVDGETGEGDNGYRADSILLVHVPRDRSRVYLVALPRDLGVEIPDRGFGKLNSAFYYGSHHPGGKPDLAGGAELTARTVTALSGLRIDGTATLTFTGLRKLTDAVGGVPVCLDQPVRSHHTGRIFEPGCEPVDGAGALDLLRQRLDLPKGAYERDRNAERFTTALLGKVARERTLTDPAKLLAIVQTLGDGLLINIGALSLRDLFGTMRQVGTADPVGIGWEYNTKRIRGEAYEQLDPALSHPLFDALRKDEVDGWTRAHPERITPVAK